MTWLAKYKGIAWLALVVMIVPLTVYRYAISGTVNQWRMTGKYRQEIEQLRSTRSLSAKPQSVSTTDTEMILSGFMVAGLLPIIESEDMRIEHFSPCVTSDKDGIILTTGQLSVQGSFAAIVKLLWHIEHDMPYGKIISARYCTTKPRNRGSTKTLTCTIYIQQIMTD